PASGSDWPSRRGSWPRWAVTSARRAGRGREARSSSDFVRRPRLGSRLEILPPRLHAAMALLLADDSRHARIAAVSVVGRRSLLEGAPPPPRLPLAPAPRREVAAGSQPLAQRPPQGVRGVQRGAVGGDGQVARLQPGLGERLALGRLLDADATLSRL